jgi:hypothetical protein
VTREEALAQLRSITRGIDADEIERSGGWWENSGGAEFGARKLAELEELVCDLTSVRG